MTCRSISRRPAAPGPIPFRARRRRRRVAAAAAALGQALAILPVVLLVAAILYGCLGGFS